MATCSSSGAYQPYDPVGPYVPGNPASDKKIADWANTVHTGMNVSMPNAGNFFQHYLDATGTDYHYDATTPYNQVGDFAATVDTTAKQQINTSRSAGLSTFDSGWREYTFPNPLHVADWYNAVGHGFYRVTGQRNADGTWSSHLQLTSYHQFRETQRFQAAGVGVNGKDMVRLAEIGKAKNFRSIGDAYLGYKTNGDPYPKTTGSSGYGTGSPGYGTGNSDYPASSTNGSNQPQP